ncbi:MAG: peptidylprolyl isomerase [Burkholderiales bacterium]|nr:peptidylprolyl isomerase [Burkholderiales bacterium]
MRLPHFLTATLLLCCSLFTGLAAAANPQVEFKTNVGSFVVELYADKAPATADNFLRYVNDGFYQGTIFHRVIPDFVVQGGGFTKDYQQKPTRQPVKNEAANGLKNVTATLAMARTADPHSATAQFFINLKDNNALDYRAPTSREYGYTVFGRVVKGMDVVQKIAAIPTGAGGPFPAEVPQQTVIVEETKVLTATK